MYLCAVYNQLGAMLELYCPNWNWHGDGICDSLINVVECNYDEGGCCGSGVNIAGANCQQCLCELNILVTPTLFPTNYTGNNYCSILYLL